MDFTKVVPKLVRSTALFGQVPPEVILGPANVSKHPAWAPLETGVCFGWKACTYGWFGYQSALVGPQALMRVHPVEGIGFLITTPRGYAPFLVAQSIFYGDLVGNMVVPKPKRTVPVSGADLCGTYARATCRTVVSMSNQTLMFDAEFFGNEESRFGAYHFRHRGALIPFGDDIFSVQPKERRHFSYVAFIRNSSGEATHLWNGRLLWKKLA